MNRDAMDVAIAGNRLGSLNAIDRLTMRIDAKRRNGPCSLCLVPEETQSPSAVIFEAQSALLYYKDRENLKEASKIIKNR